MPLSEAAQRVWTNLILQAFQQTDDPIYQLMWHGDASDQPCRAILAVAAELDRLGKVETAAREYADFFSIRLTVRGFDIQRTPMEKALDALLTAVGPLPAVAREAVNDRPPSAHEVPEGEKG
jgi:hypothetical protein